MKRSLRLKFLNLWPPYLGAGVRVLRMAGDFRSVDVEMRLTFWNKNLVGTHFGGSLYAMTDPFFMLMLIENLGPDYIVWDKAASIRFRKPGKGTVRARFELSEERIAAIREEAARSPKVEPVFKIQVVDEAGEVVAEVEKTLYIRRKDKPRTLSAPPSLIEG